MERKRQPKPRKKSEGTNHYKNEKNEDIVLSRALSWVLRHGASSLGLKMTTDGYIPIAAILACGARKLNKYKEEDVKRVVATNDKQRFSLCVLPIMTLDNFKTYSFPIQSDQNNEIGVVETLCIRANQGHSIKDVVAEDLLYPISPEKLEKLLIVHGTNKNAWEKHIRKEGLSRMGRNHIHFAPGLPDSGTHVISGMRKNCEIHIFIDGAKCAKDNVKFYQSANGVILTPGANERGILAVDYFKSVIDVKTDNNILNKESEGAINTRISKIVRNGGSDTNSDSKTDMQSQENEDTVITERTKQLEKDPVKDRVKRAKKLRKTLGEIAKLKEKDPSSLNEDQLKKIAKENSLVIELNDLDPNSASKMMQSQENEDTVTTEQTKQLEKDPVKDRVKRVKKLRKTLGEIAKLKEKDPSSLNEDQLKKIAKENSLVIELNDLDPNSASKMIQY